MSFQNNIVPQNNTYDVSHIFRLPPVDVPPYATYRGKENNFKATNTYPDNWICHNPNGNGNCPVTFCSCCAGPCCSCNKPAYGKRRYIKNIRPVYF